MSAARAIEVKGFKEVQRALERLEPKIQRKITRKAARVAAKTIKPRAQAYARAQTNPANRTDMMLRIARRLKVRALGRNFTRKGIIGAKIETPTREELGLPANSKGYPPIHIELGTKKTAARPYLRPALKDGEGEARRAFVDAIREGIREAAR